MKKIAIVLVVLSLLFLWMFGGCVIPQKQLKVSTNEIVLFVGDTFEIQVESHSLDQVVFSSDNTAIATVDTNGIVAAIGEGEAQILVTVSTQTAFFAISERQMPKVEIPAYASRIVGVSKLLEI